MPQFEMSVWRSGELLSHIGVPLPPRAAAGPAGAAATAAARRRPAPPVLPREPPVAVRGRPPASVAPGASDDRRRQVATQLDAEIADSDRDSRRDAGDGQPQCDECRLARSAAMKRM